MVIWPILGENADSDAGSLVEKSQHHAPVMNIENAQPARVCPSIMVQVDDKEQCACVQNSSSIFIRYIIIIIISFDIFVLYFY